MKKLLKYIPLALALTGIVILLLPRSTISAGTQSSLMVVLFATAAVLGTRFNGEPEKKAIRRNSLIIAAVVVVLFVLLKITSVPA